MSLDGVVRQIVGRLVLWRTIMKEKFISVHQIDVMGSTQRKYLLMKQVSHQIYRIRKKSVLEDLKSKTDKIVASHSIKISTAQAPISMTTATSPEQTSFSCYKCSGLNKQPCKMKMSNCPMCMVYRNDHDPSVCNSKILQTSKHF